MGRNSVIAATSNPSWDGMIENKAAELGPSQFPWWQDWRGECAAIVASGPSVKGMKLDVLRDRIHVIAIKENVNLLPWADVVYGCDAAWWLSRNGLPDFKGVRICHGPQASNKYKFINKINIENVDKLLTDQPAVIGSGGNSGFQALNLAVQFGATSIILIGFDMHGNSGTHWYGRNKWPGANNPQDSNYMRWLKGLNAIAPELKRRQIEVVNATPNSAVACFRMKGLDETLCDWGL